MLTSSPGYPRLSSFVNLKPRKTNAAYNIDKHLQITIHSGISITIITLDDNLGFLGS